MAWIFFLGIIGFLIFSRGFRQFALVALAFCLVIAVVAYIVDDFHKHEAEIAKAEAVATELRHIAAKDCGYENGQFDLGNFIKCQP
jgi:hypothetical protein